ncbi:hypothetical protein GCM10027592_14120 [Spirosoma flavus]
MAVHLIAYLKDQFSPAVVDKLGSILNESPADTLKAINGVLPTLLGGITRRVQMTGGASSTVSFLDKGDYGNIPLDISQTLNNQPPFSETVSASRDFLNHIFDDKLTGVTELISTYSGVKPQSVLSILGLAGSILMGVLGRHEQENGLTSSGLKTLLIGQATEFRKSLPNGLGGISSLLGFDELVTPTGPQTEVQGTDNLGGDVLDLNIPKSPEGDRRQENVRWLRWAMIAMAILVIALLIQKCGQNQNGVDGISTDSTARVESNQMEDTSATTKQSVEEANGQASDSTAPGPLGIRDSTKVKP